ncbi:nuclear transcription factor Y subunit B [Trichinella spiralis]|uniref:nuclear transcription factor Y subunit B n=1 Tax=Trichinella spiralis TaxID=6334 RepID=UPI0001EFB832|nr:nuclear transcription factor Y subunit B [Trichinella spiralis]
MRTSGSINFFASTTVKVCFYASWQCSVLFFYFPSSSLGRCRVVVVVTASINSDWSSLVGAPPRRRGLASVSATQAARHSEARVQTIVLGGVSRTRACSNTSPTCRRQ